MMISWHCSIPLIITNFNKPKHSSLIHLERFLLEQDNWSLNIHKITANYA